jgi:hypothetical protein
MTQAKASATASARPTGDAGPPATQRLASQDAFRGFTMFWIVGGKSLLLALGALQAGAVIKRGQQQEAPAPAEQRPAGGPNAFHHRANVEPAHKTRGTWRTMLARLPGAESEATSNLFD